MSIARQREATMLQDISSEILHIYGALYDPDQTKATTYLNDNVVICILQEMSERPDRDASMEARIAFQQAHQEDYTAVVERASGRQVVSFLSANQTSPGVAAELFFLSPLTEQ